MPIAGLKKLDGSNVRYEEINPVRDAEEFGVTPAMLAFLIHGKASREDAAKDGISASKWGVGTCSLWLDRHVDVFVDPRDSMAATVGSLRHRAIELASVEGIITEERFFDSETGGRISAKIDSAWVTKVEDGKRHITVCDFKTGAPYSLKMYREEIGTHAYTMQISLAADLIEQAHPDVVVDRLVIEWCPAGASASRGDEQYALIDVPRIPNAVEQYRQKLAELDAHDANTMPDFCSPEERWERFDKKQSRTKQTKCEGFCPYLAACKERGAALDRVHPTEGGF